ncbi:MAG: DUF3576 domain-containing protein [Rhodobacteraceae bacterium]|nr:DUF3576 domain-containing protein [Paracoccaceae bacterium]
MFKSLLRGMIIVAAGLSLAACGGFGNSGSSGGGIFSGIKAKSKRTKEQAEVSAAGGQRVAYEEGGVGKKRGTVWDLFSTPDQNSNVRVNKYLWNASLETLSFLPVESADPFTGVLVMGWGRAPGASRQYRATVLVQDPALDARSLKLSIQTRGGPASAETVRRIEDAIMTRARQLRIRGNNL